MTIIRIKKFNKPISYLIAIICCLALIITTISFFFVVLINNNPINPQDEINKYEFKDNASGKKIRHLFSDFDVESSIAAENVLKKHAISYEIVGLKDNKTQSPNYELKIASVVIDWDDKKIIGDKSIIVKLLFNVYLVETKSKSKEIKIGESTIEKQNLHIDVIFSGKDKLEAQKYVFKDANGKIIQSLINNVAENKEHAKAIIEYNAVPKNIIGLKENVEKDDRYDLKIQDLDILWDASTNENIGKIINLTFTFYLAINQYKSTVFNISSETLNLNFAFYTKNKSWDHYQVIRKVKTTGIGTKGYEYKVYCFKANVIDSEISQWFKDAVDNPTWEKVNQNNWHHYQIIRKSTKSKARSKGDINKIYFFPATAIDREISLYFDSDTGWERITKNDWHHYQLIRRIRGGDSGIGWENEIFLFKKTDSDQMINNYFGFNEWERIVKLDWPGLN